MVAPSSVHLTPNHPDFPMGARSLKRPAESLYLIGRLPRGRSIAIVGTRRSTDEANQFTRLLAQQLGLAGIAVWSGGASGIDAAAHEGALLANAVSVVVMGTGFDHLYPVQHRELFERVLHAEGAWLSPFAPNVRGAKWTFLHRNEWLAALVDEVIVVQAPERSGARITAAFARAMGKPVWAVPSCPWIPQGQGCLAELALGAKPLTSAEQITRKKPAERPRPVLTAQEQEVYRAVQAGATHFDAVCLATGRSPQCVAAALMTLTLHHMLLERSDGTYYLENY